MMYDSLEDLLAAHQVEGPAWLHRRLAGIVAKEQKARVLKAKIQRWLQGPYSGSLQHSIDYLTKTVRERREMYVKNHQLKEIYWKSIKSGLYSEDDYDNPLLHAWEGHLCQFTDEGPQRAVEDLRDTIDRCEERDALAALKAPNTTS